VLPLLASALLLGLAGTGLRAEETAIVDDDAIVKRVEAEGAAMLKDGKAVHMKALRTQLPKLHHCALALPPVADGPLSPEEIYARRSQGVLVVGVLGREKKKHAKLELAACSGFALSADGIFVTNYHVIDNPDAETIVVMTRDGQITPASEILAADKLTDIAIVRAPGATFTPLPLAPDVPSVGSTVWVISHPDHNFYSFTSGVVSRHFIADTEFGRTPQMAITADFGSGSSGGPILDSHGRVSGMVCSTTSVYWEDEKSKDSDLQMVFKHCIPVGSIRRLIEETTPIAPPAAVTTAKTAHK
jgi:S1-C subfamily serine protease